MVLENPSDKPMVLLPAKRVLTLIFIFCISFIGMCPCSEADTLIPISPEPVGSGARALGQSAFIAVADDATAASWNPAGLINLEKSEFSFVGIWRTISNDPTAVDRSVLWTGESWSETEVNFMSYAHRLAVGNTDLVMSINYHQVYDLGLNHNQTDWDMKVRSKGAISAYSLAGGLSIPDFPELTFGASFNQYDHSLHNDYVRQVRTSIPGYALIETLDDLRGHNFTFGLLWNAYEKEENLLTLGLVYHTPFTAEVDNKREEIRNGQPPQPFGTESIDIDFPPSLGVGVNYRFCDVFSTAFDIQQTNWSEYTYTEAESSPSDDALAFRLGCEHLFPERDRDLVLACRAGVFYEPRPAWDDILPVYGFSAGLGLTVMEQYSLDLAYQFRTGEGDFIANDEEFNYEIEEHWFIGSVIIYFPQ